MQRHLGPFVFAIVLFSLLAASCEKLSGKQGGASQPNSPHQAIVFMTDFGTANDAVALCKAVILNIAPDARIMDITHQVTPYQIEEGARFLAGVSPYYPPGTVFLAVVDPGVGTSRKAVIVKTKRGQYFVLPDNGLITPVLDRDGLDSAREITNTTWMLTPAVSSTFHGRDIFSPAAAHLAAGWDYTIAGPQVSELVRLNPKTATIDEKGISGDVIGLDDPFGSLITDIRGDDFRAVGYAIGDKVSFLLNGKQLVLPFGKTFMDVPVGDALLYQDSRGRIGIAVNQGNFSKKFGIDPPATFFVPRKGASLGKKQ
ncbi:MAG TPA: SAM-dependent chlorinase/fluorinase [Candidatus Acidoferrum sp.]|nr:SAM-dependent chlorinase/fluorinase [Candidatus Acidoferrum sp.]